jgi:hypothetical protein
LTKFALIATCTPVMTSNDLLLTISWSSSAAPSTVKPAIAPGVVGPLKNVAKVPLIASVIVGNDSRASTSTVPPPMRARSHTIAFASARLAAPLLPRRCSVLMNGLRFMTRFVNGTPLKSNMSIAVRSAGPSQKNLLFRNSLRSVAPAGSRR